MFLNHPRGFRDPALIAERHHLLTSTHTVIPLEAWARDVEDRRRSQLPDIVVPHFDPAEAGIAARTLLLLEAPGPKTVPRWGGSGFISSDNDDVTASNIWTARNDTGLHDQTLVWNILPWVLGRASVKPTATELAHGAAELRGLLELLPDLRVIVVAGDKAKAGWDTHLDHDLGERYRVLCTVQPAARSFTRLGNRERFSATLAKAAELSDPPAGRSIVVHFQSQ